MTGDGGDAACWLERVCPECGAVIEDGREHRCRTPVPAPASGEEPDPGG